MNIFKLDENPFVCARYHCDKHVPKMGLETTQLMNNAIHYYRERLSDNELSVSYFSSYIHKAKESPNEELSPRGMMWYYIDDAVNNGDLKLYKPTHVNHQLLNRMTYPHRSQCSPVHLSKLVRASCMSDRANRR